MALIEKRYGDGFVVQTGGDDPPESEWALGNIVKLNKPWKPSDLKLPQRMALFGEGSALENLQRWRAWEGFRYGIIVEHVGRNAFGNTQVALHLYDPERGVLLMSCNNLPEYLDFCVTEFELYKVATETGYQTEESKRAKRVAR